MNTIKKLLLLLVGVSSFVAACTKLEDLPFYLNGNPVVLTASKTAVTPAVGDSNNAVISFSWTNPKYSSDSSRFKYILEIDSTGRNFAKKVTRELTGALPHHSPEGKLIPFCSNMALIWEQHTTWISEWFLPITTTMSVTPLIF